MKIKYFDAEMSNLNANYGVVICGCFLVNENKKPIVYRIDDYQEFLTDPANDRRLLKAIKKEIEDTDILITYNGKRFDLPFINSRLAYWKMETLLSPKHIDLFPIIKWHYKLSDYKLFTASRFFNTIESKTAVDGMMWVRMAVSKKARNYIVKHCVKDVLVLREVFERVKGSVRWIK